MPAVRCESNSVRICGHTSRGMRCAFVADCVAARHVNSCRAKPRAAYRAARGGERQNGGGEGGGKRRRHGEGGDTRSFELFGVRLKCHWRKRAAGSVRLRGKPYFVSDTTALLLLLSGEAWSCRYDHVRSWIVRDSDLPSACLLHFLREAWNNRLLSPLSFRKRRGDNY